MRNAGLESEAKRNAEDSEKERRRSKGAAGWEEKRRPEAGGMEAGLAFGERCGGNDAGAFFHGDDLVGGNVL